MLGIFLCPNGTFTFDLQYFERVFGSHDLLGFIFLLLDMTA